MPLLPEALCLLCEGSWVPSIGWLVQLGQQGLAGLLARVVGKFDRDGLGGTRRLLAVQTLDGLLGLHPPVKADEADPSGNTCRDFVVTEWSFDEPLNHVLTMDQDGTPLLLQLFLEVLYLKLICSHLSIVFKGSHVAWLIQTKPIQDTTTLDRTHFRYGLISC